MTSFKPGWQQQVSYMKHKPRRHLISTKSHFKFSHQTLATKTFWQSKMSCIANYPNKKCYVALFVLSQYHIVHIHFYMSFQYVISKATSEKGENGLLSVNPYPNFFSRYKYISKSVTQVRQWPSTDYHWVLQANAL